jgi:hypothetical protein
VPQAIHALRHHWPEYLIEAWGLGMFMVSAGVAVEGLSAMLRVGFL